MQQTLDKLRRPAHDDNSAMPAASWWRGLQRSYAGLYQVARHAEACGYSLELAHNADGKVSFVLSGPLKPAAEPPA